MKDNVIGYKEKTYSNNRKLLGIEISTLHTASTKMHACYSLSSKSYRK